MKMLIFRNAQSRYLNYNGEYKPDIPKGWKKLTFVAETFHEEISNAFNISVKIPAKARIIYDVAFNAPFSLLANENILIG